MTKRAEKRLRQRLKAESKVQEDKQEVVSVQTKHEIRNPILRFYDKNYKLLLIIPLLIFILAIVQIGYQMSTHNGDFFNKDISLKGGITITIPTTTPANIQDTIVFLASKGYAANVRNLESSGKTIAVLVESGIDMNNHDEVDGLISAISELIPLKKGDYSLEGIGSSIGESFFKQTMIAIIFSFLLMSIIVAITFRTFVPCIAVIGAALSDIIITLAIANIIGMEISTAGIAAFLMLIGYSVDTDILLTTRVLKRKEGSILDRIISAMKTGMLMNFTTLAILVIGIFISSSEIIKQIMIILFIGLLVDQINTWIQNAGILRLYMEKKRSKNEL